MIPGYLKLPIVVFTPAILAFIVAWILEGHFDIAAQAAGLVFAGSLLTFLVIVGMYNIDAVGTTESGEERRAPSGGGSNGGSKDPRDHKPRE